MKANKEQLKSLFKPLIKECVKELILEEGVLSTLISEIRKTDSASSSKKVELVEQKHVERVKAEKSAKLQEAKKTLYSAVGSDLYSNIFANLEPLTSYEAGESTNALSGPLSGHAPTDPGVDITSIPGMNMWKTLASDKKR